MLEETEEESWKEEMVEAESAESWESGWRHRARRFFPSDFLDRKVLRSVGKQQNKNIQLISAPLITVH